MCEGMCFFFLCWPLEYDRPRELHQSIYGKKHREKRCPVPGAICQVPTAACCPLSARYPRPEKAPASGPPPCSPAPSKHLPGRSRTGSAPHAAFFLHAAPRFAALPACLLPTFFCKAVSRFTRQAQIGVLQGAIANVDSPPAHLCGSPHGRTATRNVRPTHRLPESACNSPVVTAAAIRLLPSLCPFPLHTVACIPLLNRCSWRFDGEACIDLACMGQTPWPTSHATKSSVAGRSAARITAKPGSARRLHAASSHGPSWALFAKAHVSLEVVPWPLPKASRIFFGIGVCRKWWTSLRGGCVA